MQTASNMKARIRIFTSMLLMIIKSSIKFRAGLLIWISCLDAVNAASKIALVLVIALSVRALGSPEVHQDVYGFTFDKTEGLIYFFGAIIGLIALISALSSYASAVYSRKLGRWANKKSFDQLKSVLSLSPREAQYSQLNVPNNINIILMQLPLHTGLAFETVVRMINPFLLMIFSAAALFYQNALFSVIIVGLSLLVIPVVLSTSLAIQRNARSFYGAQSLSMGGEVSNVTNILSNQHGIIEKQEDEELNYSKDFFDSFDLNILANYKTGLIISILDAITRPILFIVVGTLVFSGKFSIDAAIAFLGSLAYLLTSSRTVMGSLTNLLRFQPQVQQYQELTGEAEAAGITADSQSSNLSSKSDASRRSGYSTLILFPQAFSTLSLSKYMQPVKLWAEKRHVIINDEIYFSNASFRFKQETTIFEQLCGTELNKVSISVIKSLCSELKASESIEALKSGFDTPMTEQVWGRLDSAARVALRCIPLALKPKGATIFIDISVIKSLNPNDHKVLLSHFEHLNLIIFSNGEYLDLEGIADYALFSENGSISSGDRSWFREELVEWKKEHASSTATHLDPTTSLI